MAADDQPIPVRFHIRRRYLEVITRRSKRSGRSVETEMAHLVESACRALMGDTGTFAERVQADVQHHERTFTQAEVNRLIEDRIRRARESWERSRVESEAGDGS